MKTHIAKFISIILHPLLMPTFGTIFLLFSGTYNSFIDQRMKVMILFVICTGTFILPISFIPAFLYRKVILSMDMPSNSERIVPLSVTSVMYIFVVLLLKNYHAPILILKFVLSATISVVLVTIITTKWKISAHLTGIGGLIGIIFYLLIYTKGGHLGWFFISIILAGVLGSARLTLDSHTSRQIYSGFAIGFFIVLFVMVFL